MVKQRVVFGFCCALILAVSGCSRQQSDWQKTRETNTADAYEIFLKKYPKGEFTAQAQARAKELYEERDWQKARDADTAEAYQAFLKQYPEGKWTEEARIRVENFTLAQAPSGAAATPSSAGEGITPGVAPTAGDAADDTGSKLPPPTSPTSPTSPAPPRAVKPPVARSTTPPSAAKPTPAEGPAEAAPRAGPKGPSPANAKAGRQDPGSYGVQLGAFKSGAHAARERWARLQKEYPAILAGLSSKVVQTRTASGSLYRLRATGLSEKRARAVCSSLKAKSQVCVLVPPARKSTE